MSRKNTSVGAAAGGEPGAGAVRAVDKLAANQGADDLRLFELYVARIATIDRYHVPITDRAMPTACKRAFDEAKVALDVFEKSREEGGAI